MAIHLSIGSLKTCSGLEPVPRCEPSTYQPISHDITTALSGPVQWQNHRPVDFKVLGSHLTPTQNRFLKATTFFSLTNIELLTNTTNLLS